MSSKYLIAIMLVIYMQTGYELGSAAPSAGDKSSSDQKKHVAEQTIIDVCTYSPLLAKYAREGFLSRPEHNLILLKLTADLHSLDCGAPDCYGTHLEVQLRVLPKASQCLLQSAFVRAENFFCSDMKQSLSSEDLRIGEAHYQFERQNADLSDAKLKKLVFRSQSTPEALVLLPENFYYFAQAAPEGILRTRLPGEEDNEESCCWGASSSQLNRPGDE